MKNKKLIISLIIVVFVILSSILLMTYGYMTGIISGNETSKKYALRSKILKVEYSDGTEVLSSNNDKFIPGSIIEKTFTVKNVGDEDLYFDIILDEVSNTFSRTNDITYELYNNDNIISQDIFPTTETETISSNLYIKKDEIKKYKIKIKYLNSTENQIEDSGKNISAKIIFEKKDKPYTKYNILGNSYQEVRTGKNLANLVNHIYSTSSSTLISDTNNIFRVKGNDGLEVCAYSAGQVNFVFDPIATTNKTITISFYATRYSDGKWKDSSSNVFTLLTGTDSTNYAIHTQVFKDYTAYPLNTRTLISYTFTPTFDIGQLSFRLNGMEWGIEYNTIQIEESSTATSYEKYGATPTPDNPSEIKSLGEKITDTNDKNYNKYKINIKMMNKNIFNKTNFINTYIKYYKYPDVAYVKEDTFDGKNVIKMYGGLNLIGRKLKYMKGYFEKNTSYTISFDYYDVKGKTYDLFGPNIYLIYTDGTQDKILVDSSDRFVNVGTWHSRNFTTNSSKTVDYLKISYGTAEGYTYFYNFQIEKNETQTDYEEYAENNYDLYLDEPLRCVGNYCDYIDLINKKVVRKINTITFTGTESWTIMTGKAMQYDLSDKIDGMLYNVLAQSNYYVGDSWENVYKGKIGVSRSLSAIRIRPSETLPTVDEWKTLLQEKNNAGNPLVVNYVMENTKEEYIDLPDIKDLNNKNIFISDNTLTTTIEKE